MFLIPAFLLNLSRMAWIAVPCASLIVIFQRSKKLAGILFIMACLAAGVMSPRLQARLALVLDPVTYVQRIDLAKSGIEIFEDFPVFGAGLGMFEKLYPVYRPEDRIKYIHADNTYAEMLAETGLVGFAAFFFFVIRFLQAIFKRLSVCEDKEWQTRFPALLAGLLASLMISVATNNLTVGVRNAPLFWFSLGLAVGGISRRELGKAGM